LSACTCACCPSSYHSARKGTWAGFVYVVENYVYENMHVYVRVCVLIHSCNVYAHILNHCYMLSARSHMRACTVCVRAYVCMLACVCVCICVCAYRLFLRRDLSYSTPNAFSASPNVPALCVFWRGSSCTQLCRYYKLLHAALCVTTQLMHIAL